MWSERFASERPPEYKQHPYFIPETHHSAKDHLHLVEEALDQLPVESFDLLEHPLTGEIVFRAPEGYKFRLGGKFQVWSDSDHPDIRLQPPLLSTATQEAEYEERDIDPDNFESVRQRSDRVTLDFIDGRFLSIGLKDDWINGADDGSDSWEKRWTTGNWPSSDHARPELEISIMPDSVDVVDLADVLAKYELPLPTGPNNEQQTWLFDMPRIAFAWKSYRAKAKLSELDIQLIPDDESNNVISVEIPNDKRLKKIWKPWWRISKEDMTGEDFGVSFMLAMLSGGHQDLAKPTPSLYQVRSHPEEIERWARLALDDELPYYGIAGMLSPEVKEYNRRDMRRKFGKELTLVEGFGNISLHQLAKVFSDPNWLEDRLSKFWGWNSGDD